MSRYIVLWCISAVFSAIGMAVSYADTPARVIINGAEYAIYPETLDNRPLLQSPYTSPEGIEYVLALTQHNTWAIVPVTVENSERNGPECVCDSIDFPFYAHYGIHADIELLSTQRVTGRSVARITMLGRPGGLSEDGFMAADEDIISVLRGDNELVKKLGLTHTDLARPLFHVWNMMLTDLDLDRWNMAVHKWENMVSVEYHGGIVELAAEDTKGGQQSIFDDGIEGGFFISIHRVLTPDEEAFLRERYNRLTPAEWEQFITLLTTIQTGEMEPYYIMRYGFYEGHTPWRTDPVTIAWVFGLKSLAEIEQAFPGKLWETLTDHHGTGGN